MAKFILGAVLALALAGCGGGAGSNPFVPPASACTPRVVTVSLLGDSTNAGYFSSNGSYLIADPTPAQELQANMDAEFGAGAVIVTSYAVRGTTALDAPKVIADVIVANYGINDMQSAAETLPVYVAAMKAIGATLIETQGPIINGQNWNESGYVAAAAGLGLPVADVHAYVLSLPNWQAMLSDTIHPLPALYKEVDDQVLAPAVAKQVAPLRCMAG